MECFDVHTDALSAVQEELEDAAQANLALEAQLRRRRQSSE